MRTQTNCHVTTTLLLLHNCISSNNPDQRLNEDICTLSTLCSSYKKLSPTTEFPPMRLLSPNQDSDQGDVLGILNLLKMWQAGGQLKDPRVRGYLEIANCTQVCRDHLYLN